MSALEAKSEPLYDLVDVVGWMAAKSGPTEREIRAMESMLEYKLDPMATALALTILSSRWNLPERVSNAITTFLHGVPWDLEQDAKLSAAAAAGPLLMRQKDRQLLSALLSTVKDPLSLSGTRDAAYSSLAMAMGIPLREQITRGMAPPAHGEDDSVISWAVKAIGES